MKEVALPPFKVAEAVSVKGSTGSIVKIPFIKLNESITPTGELRKTPAGLLITNPLIVPGKPASPVTCAATPSKA